MSKIITYLLLISIFTVGCQEVIDIDLNEGEPTLVVEGLITDQPGPYRVKLSLTTSYFDDESAPSVTTAIVIITENSSLVDTLIQIKPGVYHTKKIMQAAVGNTYDLLIRYDGESYESSTELKSVSDLDSLTYEFEEENIFLDEGYYVSLWAQEPEGMGDYYRWIYYSNGEIADSLDLLYSSDEFIDGSYISGFQLFYTQQLGDTVLVEQLSLNEDAYEFYRQLDEQESFGNLFDTPPANITGNISNRAWGLFEASSVKSKEIIIE